MSAAAPAPPVSLAPQVASAPRRGRRLPFLDGLRALAALYVLIFHELSAGVVGHGVPSPALKAILPHLNRGRFGVVFFIVLSGFSLMLPLARAGVFGLVGGFPNYVFRRAKRIFPPYYAALLLSIAVIVIYNHLGAVGDGQRVDAALRPGSIISHLFLVHNLTFEWAYRINGPMWSVATEWQIYFVFPALLLPLWRRAGGTVTILVAWLLGALPFYALPPDDNFFWACPWFLGSFALGMAGAVLGYSPAYAGSALRRSAPWGALTVLLFLALFAICATGWADRLAYPIVDLVVSGSAFCLICFCVREATAEDESRSATVAILGSRLLVYLGGFSYSLYLVQHPVLRLVEKVCNRLPLGYNANIALELALGTPAVLATAWVFSELFERPFTSGGILLPALRRRGSAAGSSGPLNERRPTRS